MSRPRTLALRPNHTRPAKPSLTLAHIFMLRHSLFAYLWLELAQYLPRPTTSLAATVAPTPRLSE
ncbi:hypothetical protein [Actinobaculum suis]|uniref:hypothetical protein n=1 Tax=Actinobaculum suis TaxID=1657 RepID=UPI00163CEAE6|nr:hypothetical protein [Actinobaculum suis]